MRASSSLSLLFLPLLALGATGCHRHHYCQGPMVPTVVEAPPPAVERTAAGPAVIIYVTTNGSASVETQQWGEQAGREAAERDAATREQARIEHERAEQVRLEQERIERERAEQARIEQERAEQARIEQERAAQAAKRAKSNTTIIVISPGSPPQVIPSEGWVTQ